VVIELTGQSLLQSFPLSDSRWQPLRLAADVIYHVVSGGVKEKPNESSPGLLCFVGLMVKQTFISVNTAKGEAYSWLSLGNSVAFDR
jgi:hypothetical protein